MRAAKSSAPTNGRFAFHQVKDGRLLDFDITITAGAKDVVFGDDKDGAMAIRVAESMRVEKAKSKGEKKAPPGEGHIVTSERQEGRRGVGDKGRVVRLLRPGRGQDGRGRDLRSSGESAASDVVARADLRAVCGESLWPGAV